MRDDNDMAYLLADGFGFTHGYEMDAPDRLPAGGAAKAWHDDAPYQQSVIR